MPGYGVSPYPRIHVSEIEKCRIRASMVLLSLWQIVFTQYVKCIQNNTDSTVGSRHSAAQRKLVVAKSHSTAAANGRLSNSITSALPHQEQENTPLARHVTLDSGRLVGSWRGSSSRDSMGLAALPGCGTRLDGITAVSPFGMQGTTSATPVFAESVLAYPASPLSIRGVPSGAPQASSDPGGRFSAEAISIRGPPLAAGLGVGSPVSPFDATQGPSRNAVASSKLQTDNIQLMQLVEHTNNESAHSNISIDAVACFASCINRDVTVC